MEPDIAPASRAHLPPTHASENRIHEPGRVNGVPVRWPTGGCIERQAAPIERPCLFGHLAGRYANHRCKECQREHMRRNRRKAKGATP